VPRYDSDLTTRDRSREDRVIRDPLSSTAKRKGRLMRLLGRTFGHKGGSDARGEP